MDGDLGVYAVADLKQAFEVRGDAQGLQAARSWPSWSARGRDRTPPAPADLAGLTDFSRTTFRDTKGKVVTTTRDLVLPELVRARPPPAEGAGHLALPAEPATNLYSLGAVWGLQAGYAASIAGD